MSTTCTACSTRRSSSGASRSSASSGTPSSGRCSPRATRSSTSPGTPGRTRCGRTSTSPSRRCAAISSGRTGTGTWSSARTPIDTPGASTRAAAVVDRCGGTRSRAPRRGWSRPFEYGVTTDGVRLRLEQEGGLLLLRQLLRRDAAHADRPVRLPGPGRRTADVSGRARGEVRLARLQGPGSRARALLHRCRPNEAIDDRRLRRVQARVRPNRCPPCAIGVAGVGHWARTAHLPTVAASPDAELVALADPDPANLERSMRRYGLESGSPIRTRCWPPCALDAVIVAAPHARPLRDRHRCHCSGVATSSSRSRWSSIRRTVGR